VAACAKHFVGDGGTQNGINENNTIIDRRGLMNIHMPAYFDSLRKGVSTVMISYSSWNGEKMHANHDLITRFLKGRLNFKVKNLSDADACVSLVGIPLSSDAHSYVFFLCAGIHHLRLGRHRQDYQSSWSKLLLLCPGFNSRGH
jgi:beta-glucosidase-like glycosyl hydrolase